MSTPPERCPTCGQTIPTLLAFQAHLRAVAGDEPHVTALWALLGIDYTELQDDERVSAELRTRAQGWQLL